jgi:hypothetical protein
MKQALLVLLAIPLLCLAQYDTSTILGTVKDPSGSQVAGANVTLENTQTGVRQSSTTDSSGNFLFLNLRIGTFRVSAEHQGFKKVTSEVFTLVVNARQRVDLTLEVGNVAESVTVSGAASQLETDSSDRGQVITREAIVNLPLNGRAYADLALLSPGVRKSNISNRDASFNVNGLRSSFNNFMVDGVDNNAYGTSNQGFSNQVVQLTPDAVQEFKVQTNNFSAEYGRAGGAVINASVRSGTNQLHGSAWEYLRNTKLNAVGFFKPSTGKPTLVQNQFGGTLGGPIKKDKLFLFGDYEGFRRVDRTLGFASIPTLEQRQGNIGIPIRNPLTGELYPNGIVPASQITPFARRVLGDLPAPIRSTPLGQLPTNNYDNLVPTAWQDDKGDIRGDYYISSKLNAFGRYSHRLLNRVENSVIPGPSGGDANGNVRVLNKQTAFGFNYNVSATSLIDFRFALSVFEGGKSALGGDRPNMLAEYGIPGLPDTPEIGGGLTRQGISGYSAIGRQDSNPQFQNPTTWNPKVNYSKVLNRHTLKAGYEYQRINTDILDFNPQYGNDSYGGQFSRPAGVTTANNLYNIADFLFGARSSYQLNNQVILNYRQRMHFGYLQDDWKVNSKLTLNLGVRYEFATPQYEEKNRLANFDPVANKLIQASAGSLYNRTLVHPDRNNWAPRFGMAYQLNGKTVVRTGYGMSYVHFNRLGGENLLGYNGPSIVNLAQNQVAFLANGDPTPACTGNNFTGCFRTTQQGYPVGLVDPSRFSTANTRTNYTPSDYRTSYVQSYHFTVQRELANNLVLDVGYVGNKSTGLMILGDYNQARPLNAGETANLLSRRPITGFDAIQVSYGGGFANYHALQAKIEKRYANGFYLLNSFTWSKAIDNAGGHLETFNGDNSRINYRNLASEKGQGSYNQPLNNTTSFVYEVPFGKGRKYGSSTNGFADAILGGWRLNGIHIAQSGQPVNISYTLAAAAQVSTYPTYRPNYVGGDIYATERSATRYLNPAAFAVPSTTTPFGTLGRNAGRSEAIYQFDAGLHKAFTLPGERFKLEFRSEFFNLFNVTNWGAPNSNISNANFGTITSYAYPAIPARQIQFALRLGF